MSSNIHPALDIRNNNIIINCIIRNINIFIDYFWKIDSLPYIFHKYKSKYKNSYKNVD